MCPAKFKDDEVQVPRRDVIASAAIEVLATQGLRGLTHRAVDAVAGLSIGSVNYYAPTRGKLLDLALKDLFARDFEIAVSIFGGLAELRPLTVEAVVARIVDFVEAMTQESGKQRVIARHIMLGEAQHNPAVRAMFDTARATFISFTEKIFVSVDPTGEVGPTSVTARMTVLTIEGLIQGQVLVGVPLTRHDMEYIVARLFARPSPVGIDSASMGTANHHAE